MEPIHDERGRQVAVGPILIRDDMNQVATVDTLWTYQRASAELEETVLPLEIWDGELIMAPAPGFNHQILVLRLAEALTGYVRRHRLGVVVAAPMDFVLEPTLVLQPDVSFISRARQHIIKNHILGAPDLAMEVISPDRRKRDYNDKKNRYAEHGAREYWMVDPRLKHIEIWALHAGAYELAGRFVEKQQAASKLLPGFKVNVSKFSATASARRR